MNWFTNAALQSKTQLKKMMKLVTYEGGAFKDPDGNSVTPVGTQGSSAGLQFSFSASTGDADPGAGVFRLNNVNPALATQLFISDTVSGGANISSFVDIWTPNSKIFIRSNDNLDATLLVYNVVSVVVATGYRKVTIQYVSGNSVTNAEACVIQYYTSGTNGVNAYHYRGYASASDGTGFTLVFDPLLSYHADKFTTSPIASPVASDFAGLWYKATAVDGTNGLQGNKGGLRYNYAIDTTGGVRPGNGKFKFNSTTFAAGSIDHLYIDYQAQGSINIAAVISTWRPGSRLTILSNSNTDTQYAVVDIVKVVDNSTWFDITVVFIAGSPFIDNQATVIQYSPMAELGADFALTVDATQFTDSNPGTGKLRLNNVDHTIASTLFINDIDKGGRNLAQFIASWGVGGMIMMLSRTSYLACTVSTITDQIGYTSVGVNYVGGSGFFDGDVCFITYVDGAATPTYDNLGDTGIPSASTYPDFVVMIRNVSSNPLGRPGIFKSNGALYNGIGRIITDHDNSTRKVYATSTGISWSVSNNAGLLRLTSSAAHGLATASYTDSYLHVKTAGGSFFPLDLLIPITSVISTTVIQTSIPWDAGMSGATPVFSAVGDKFKIATSIVPTLRENSRIIIDVNWEYTNSAGSKSPELQFGGVPYWTPGALTTTAIIFTPIEIYNKNNAAIQEGRLNLGNNTGAGPVTGVHPTSAINTAAAATNLTWHGTLTVAGEFLGMSSRLVEVIY